MSASGSNSPDCIRFQEHLPELFESREAVKEHEHLKTCRNCADLVDELQYIADMAKTLMPIHDPSPTVWTNIQSAIASEPPK